MKCALFTLTTWLCLAGCTEYRVVEIDFSPPRVFGPQRSEWSGKFQIVQERSKGLFGSPGWQVKRIKLPATDGRCAEVDVEGWRDIPMATIEMTGGGGLEVLGTRAFPNWMLEGRYLSGMERIRKETAAAASQPASQPELAYTTLDWMILAPELADEVIVEYRIPKEGLQVILRGSPHKSSPEVLEVRDSQGRVLNRIQREELDVDDLSTEKPEG